jgi:hypothetical protein
MLLLQRVISMHQQCAYHHEWLATQHSPETLLAGTIRHQMLATDTDRGIETLSIIGRRVTGSLKQRSMIAFERRIIPFPVMTQSCCAILFASNAELTTCANYS